MAGEAQIAWLGHSTVVLDVDGRRVLTDPLLHAHNWPLRRRGGAAPDEAWWRDPEVVLLSHLHSDHAQVSSLKRLDGIPILTAPDNATWLTRKGISSGVGMGDDWLDATGRGPQIRLVRADHGHRPMPHRPNATNGHLVRFPTATVYVAGDTDLYDEMADLPELAGGRIDGAVVPIWGWGSRLSGGHMGPEEAAKACAVVGARWALAVHWGTLHVPWLSQLPKDWMDAPGDHFAEALAEHAPGCVRVELMPGERTALPVA